MDDPAAASRRPARLASELLPPLVLLSATLAIRYSFGWHPFDDAFITLRYARNLAGGLGLVYNAGERVLGTTAPLYAILLAGLHYVTRLDLEHLAWGVNLLGDALNVLVLWRLSHSYGFGKPAAFGLTAAYATAIYAIGVTNGGMETPLFILALLLAADAIFRRQWKGLGLALGVATILRPEGLLATAIAVSLLLIKSRSGLKYLALCWGLLAVPWGLVAAWYYGSPIPQSIVAKRAVYHIERFEAAFDLLAAFGKSLTVGVAAPPQLSAAFITASLILCLFCMLVGIRALAKQEWVTWFLPAFLVAYTLFLVASNPLVFEWYISPLIPPVLIVLAAALERAFRLRTGAGALLLALASWHLLVAATGGGQSAFSHQEERVRLYRDVARWLDARGGSDDTIAASEIGALGYFLPDAYLIDTVGLVSPQSVPYHAGMQPHQLIVNYAIPPALIRDLRPDYVVSLDAFTRASLLPDESFQRSYEKVYERPAQVFSGSALEVFRRKE